MAAVDSGQTIFAVVGESSLRAGTAESEAGVGTADQQTRGTVESKATQRHVTPNARSALIKIKL